MYIGANTDKLGFGFGEPSAISKQFTAPSNDWSSFSFPSFSSNSIKNLDLDAMKIEIEKNFLVLKVHKRWKK